MWYTTSMGYWRSWERATLAVWRSRVRIPYAPYRIKAAVHGFSSKINGLRLFRCHESHPPQDQACPALPVWRSWSCSQTAHSHPDAYPGFRSGVFGICRFTSLCTSAAGPESLRASIKQGDIDTKTIFTQPAIQTFIPRFQWNPSDI